MSLNLKLSNCFGKMKSNVNNSKELVRKTCKSGHDRDQWSRITKFKYI